MSCFKFTSFSLNVVGQSLHIYTSSVLSSLLRSLKSKNDKLNTSTKKLKMAQIRVNLVYFFEPKGLRVNYLAVLYFVF